ncbi:hypothetical protein QR680_010781 [Steinernema hermaphroditum]|uniref:Uncharacterized protein n=1 Tax=Steinernema hermaphroditum TaxID=289476 RepID=A0AA39IRA1_9BILA|nr:hypothetical protein QR680_010781 [Steinernema hermaphroditum]
MDLIPYAFCEAVFVLLSMDKSNCEVIAKQLRGVWKRAAEKYAENVYIFTTGIWRDDGGQWWYNIWDHAQCQKGPASLDDLLRMDRRFVRFMRVTPGTGSISDEPAISISKQDLVNKYIPFLNLQSQRSTIFDLTDIAEHDTAVEYLKLFKEYTAFGFLTLSYYGVESENFLAAQIKNNSFLYTVGYKGCWPRSERIEDLSIEILRKPSITELCLPRDEEDNQLTMKVIKATFDLWWLSGRRVDVSGSVDETEVDVLSIPLPPDVTRSEKYEKRGLREKLTVRWSKETVPDFTCVIFVGESVSLNSRYYGGEMENVCQDGEFQCWDDDSECHLL